MNLTEFKSIDDLFKVIKRNNPFSNPEFYAMILGFCPYYYTKNLESYEVTYGEKIDREISRLIYLKIYFLMKNGAVKPEYEQMKKYFENHEYSSLVRYFDENQNLSKEREHMNVWMYYSNELLNDSNLGFGKEDVKYRLYLNVEVGYRASFCKKILEYFKKNNMSYFFKASAIKDQTDAIVLYIDSKENLLKTVNGINEIIKTNPDSITRLKDVPPHLCKINDYIGYGFDPSIQNGYDKDYSFTQFIQFCVSSSISSDFRNSFMKKIIADFDQYSSEKKLPPFSQLNKRDQYKFFINNFNYIYVKNKDSFDKMYSEITEKFHELKSNSNKSTIKKH